MKKIFLILIFSNFLLSELVLEITQGTEDPYRVALLPFKGDVDISSTLNKSIAVDRPKQTICVGFNALVSGMNVQASMPSSSYNYLESTRS